MEIWKDETVKTERLKAQAAKTTFEVREIQPASFNQVVKTTGQVLAAPGDEAVIVATSNGVVSFSSNKLTEGTKVQKGQSLFQISSKDIGDGIRERENSLWRRIQ